MNKLQKIPTAWHDEAKKLLAQHFHEIHLAFLDSTKKAVWLGIFLENIKARGRADKSIPHGEFGPWLKKNLPDIKWNTANGYMRLARAVCENGRFEIVDLIQFEHGCHIGELPPEIEKMVEGKTRAQLFLQFKNVDAEGNPRGPGRLPGEGGRKKLSFSEIVDLKRANAKEDIGQICELIHRLGMDWTALADDDLDIFDIYLDRILRAKRLWVTTPINRRADMVGDVQKILNP